MSKISGKQLSDIAKLIFDAVLGVTEVTQTMHHRIGAGPRIIGRPLKSLVRLATYPAYGLVRFNTRLTQAGVSKLIEQTGPLLNSPGMDRGLFLSVLNGVLGEHLISKAPSLALAMQLCRNGRPLDSLAEIDGPRMVLLIHGSCLHDQSWQRKGHDYGQDLERDFGIPAFYLRYNSGRHISENGRLLSSILKELVQKNPELTEIILLGHSMGGLVARSACYYGEKDQSPWIHKVNKLITLGTPHMGAPLERTGQWINLLLGVHPYSEPLAKLGHIRSAGVTDLRYGYILDEEWRDKDRFAMNVTPHRSVPFPKHIRGFFVAGSMSKTPAGHRGDGIVPIASALGQDREKNNVFGIPLEHKSTIYGTHHLGLLSHPEVYIKVREWIAKSK